MFYLLMGITIVFTFLWLVSTQRKLVIMVENVNNSLSQIGVQLSSRWDALSALLDLIKGYAEHETLKETIKTRRTITKNSSVEDVVKQQNMISEALGNIMEIAEKYPELKANQNYLKTMDAVNQYENMVHTSRQIYNDSVTKLNRSIRLFPILIFAGALGFHQLKYLETDESEMNTSSTK